MNPGTPSCELSGGTNPINIGTGNKFQAETDYESAHSNQLKLTRHYSDLSNTTGVFSWHWNAFSSLWVISSTTVVVNRPDNKQLFYVFDGNQWRASANITDALFELKDGAGARTGWQYTTANKDIEIYDTAGKLLSITDRSGLTQTLTYSDVFTPATVAPAVGLLIRITDSFGKQLNFTYDSSSRIATMTDPAGGLYTYAYSTDTNLISVTYPDLKTRNYLYNEPAYTQGANLPNRLTGIIDEKGNRFATFNYDAQGRAISSEHANGADLHTLTYNVDGSTTVTDALGTARTYQFQTILGVVKPKGQSQPGGSGCNASASALSYDANGNVTSRTEFNGNQTNYTYDLTRNLETSRTEGLTASGAATPATRTITTVWHPTLRLPVQVTQGNQQTNYTYNPQGEVIDKTVKDLAANTARTWTTTYTYGAVPGVLVQKVEDGPRTDVSDLTTYDYYPVDASCTGGHYGCRGQLQQVTDAFGHSTRLTRYNAHGQVEELIDANGLTTTLMYDARQRLLSLDSGGETTTYAYDPAGQLTRVTRPDGAYLAYTYDAAHRLIQTQDNLGNTVTYTLDALGNRVKEEAHDPSGQLARSQSRVYDALSRLQNLIQPQ
jgi:YD repeat-containing protein